MYVIILRVTIPLLFFPFFFSSFFFDKYVMNFPLKYEVNCISVYSFAFVATTKRNKIFHLINRNDEEVEKEEEEIWSSAHHSIE